MFTRRSTPLAWRNLTENKLRLAASIAGAAFAVVLMFMESGFRKALIDSMVGVIQQLDGELFLTNRSRYILAVQEPIPMRRLEQAKSFVGVAKARPFYVETHLAKWKSVKDGIPRRIRVFGMRPEDDLLTIPDIRSQLEKLRRPDTALADRRSKVVNFGSFIDLPTSELANHLIKVVGTFSLGADFQNNGNMIVSENTFLSLFPHRLGPSEGSTGIDVGVISLDPGAHPDVVRQELQSGLPEDTLVLTKDEFVAKERDFWENVTPVGIVFNIGVVMGFVVGVTICYQVLYSDISDRLPQFATLKAIGYSNGRLFGVVLRQAILLAAFGFSAGLSVSGLLYWWLGRLTGLPLRMSAYGIGVMFALTLVMCMISAVIATRKLFLADPAELFR